MRAPTRFVTDSSLDLLARRLRFLGYDVATLRGARLEEVFDAAAAQERTVLTLSARRSRRHPDVPALQVPRGDVAAALRAVANAHAPAGAPWSRCPECNVALHSRSAFEARGEVPGRVSRMRVPFTWCPSCARWYWPGSHVARMNEWLESALGRPLPGSGPASSGDG